MKKSTKKAQIYALEAANRLLEIYRGEQEIGDSAEDDEQFWEDIELVCLAVKRANGENV
jgi:hypothetical protein